MTETRMKANPRPTAGIGRVVLENKVIDPGILAQANALKSAGKLTMNTDRVKAQLDAPAPGAVALPRVRARVLPGREVARIAREGHLQLGWYYLCNHCDHWHAGLSGAYGVGKDAVATCHHGLVPQAGMREGYLQSPDPRET